MVFFRRTCIALFLSCAAQLSAQGWPNDSALNATLQSRVRMPPGIGIVVATLEKGKPPRIFSAGSSGSARPLDGNTVFEIGSITKTFTSALLADMVQRGEVKLDDPVSKFLPATVHVPSRGGKQITLLDLATQSSGLPRLPTNMSPANILNPYADYSVQQLYDFLSQYELTRDIGSRFEYSNLGVGLLGHALALRAGKSYEALVTERILEPLGMHDTRITLTPEMREHLAIGHSANGTVQPTWDLPTLAGAGALRSTASDMAKFLAANLDSTTGPVAHALGVAHVPQRDAGSDQMRIGLVWLTLNQFGTPVVWHNGGTGGYHSFIGFDPATGRGVVVLANISANIDDIGLHMVDGRFPLTVVKEHKEVAINQAILDAYVGVYELAPNFQITITKEGKSLYAQATAQPKNQLYPESDIEFFLKVVDASIIFVRGATGTVDQIILHQGGASIPGKRVK
jgi:D-alanyl-D-alanine-carboxypeptidase/D-alanyl-D-alanine-endopeptidase